MYTYIYSPRPRPTVHFLVIFRYLQCFSGILQAPSPDLLVHQVENRLQASTRGLAYRRSKCPTDVVPWLFFLGKNNFSNNSLQFLNIFELVFEDGKWRSFLCFYCLKWDKFWETLQQFWFQGDDGWHRVFSYCKRLKMIELQGQRPMLKGSGFVTETLSRSFCVTIICRS